MPGDYRCAAYPSARVYDADGNQVKHLLWGDWVRIDGSAQAGMLPVHVRNKNGWMREQDLQAERLLEIVFVDVGQGDGALIVTPADQVLLVDAGVSDNLYRFLDWRFHFLGGVREFDAAIITHPDSDHYRGFSAVFRQPNIRLKRVYHNGIMEQNGKPFGPEVTEGTVKYVAELMETHQEMEAFLADEARYGDKAYPRLMKTALARLSPGGEIRMLAASGNPAQPTYLEGFGAGGDLRIHVLGPVPELAPGGRRRLRWFRERPDGGSNDEGKTKNGHSVILRVEYRDVSVLLGGDLNASAEAYLLRHYSGRDWPPADAAAERAMVEAVRPTFGVDVAKTCHHGSADFTETFMQAVHPAATVVSSGDEEPYAHPRCDTLGAIGVHGRGRRPLLFSTELARSTREREEMTRKEMDELLRELETEADPTKRAKLIQDHKKTLNELTRRNVTTYGAINLRTDGHRAVMAYRLERTREGRAGNKKTVTEWDLYPMEPGADGVLVYVPA
jgi:beta-lactamase superfamily II metal-dependent hydrolase